MHLLGRGQETCQVPWKETCPVKERFAFMTRWDQGERPTDLCREFGISRTTAYEMRERYLKLGVKAFFDAKSVPKTIRHKTTPEVAKLIVDARVAHPSWGPKKLKAWLQAQPNNEGVRFPSQSTIHEILVREGLIKAKKKRRRAWPTPASSLTKAERPNQVWAADFKGQFELGDGTLCYPLTITDQHSRFLIACTGLDSTKGLGAMAAFQEAFAEYGLPEAIRTDNGAPFSSLALAGLSTLSVWWMRLGIRHERIEPGHPEQNGQHERMHRTLKQEATRPAKPNMLQQQVRFDHFRREFNEERPHEALGQRPPATVYEPSTRVLPPELPEVRYPFHDFTRTVTRVGTIQLMRGQPYFVTKALEGQIVGLRELENDRWLLSFMDLELAHIDVRQQRLQPVDSRG